MVVDPLAAALVVALVTAPPMQVEDPPAVAHDRFPVTVTLPDQDPLRTARVVITVPTADQPARLLVWSHPGDPLLDAPLDLGNCTIRSPLVPWLLSTPDGMVTVEREGGCGCSHPLKHWLPLSPYRMGILPS